MSKPSAPPAQPIALADRLAGLQRARQAVEAARAKEHARLDREKQAAHVKAESDLSALQAACEAEIAASNLRIAAEFHSAVRPIVAQLLTEPSRAAATPLIDIARAADAATQHELGEAFNLDRALLVATKRALIARKPEVAGALVAESADVGPPRVAAHKMAAALRSSNVGDALSAFAALESALWKAASGPAGDAADGLARLDEIERHATPNSCGRALETLTARQQAARAHATHAAWLDHTGAIRRFRAGEPAPEGWTRADEEAALGGASVAFGPVVRGVRAIRDALSSGSADQ